MLSRAQVVLIFMIILLVAALGSVVMIAYINLNTASAFQSGFMIANLGNVQREIIQLHMETNRVLRDCSKNFEPLDLRREALDKQMELAVAEAVADPNITESLKRMNYLLQRYDYGVERLRINPSEGEFRSSANQFEVRLQCRPDGAELCVHDDGIGFDVNQLLPDNLGLNIMRERAEAIGARLSVNSQPQQGTDVIVTWQPPSPNDNATCP